MLWYEQLSSIPGLEDVTIDGLSQRQTAQANGPTTASQSQADGPSAGTLPSSEVKTQTRKYTTCPKKVITLI